MTKISNSKSTTNHIFYGNGVNKSNKLFAVFATMSFPILKQVSIHNVRNARSNVSFFK